MYPSSCRKVRSDWLEVSSNQPKLTLLREIMSKHEEPTVVYIGDKRQRRMMMMIQGGTVRLRIKMCSWRNEQDSSIFAGTVTEWK